MGATQIRSLFRHGIFLIFFILLGPALPLQVFSWHSVTHVYLALEAWKDAKDGTVEIYAVDYLNQKKLAKIGEYEVDPLFVESINACPNQYKAGAIGPDAYPDMPTGQSIIHPYNEGKKEKFDLYTGEGKAFYTTNQCLEYFWHKFKEIETGGASVPEWKNEQEDGTYEKDGIKHIRAFMLGYLMHACGDVFGHAFINYFTGHPFQLGDNMLRHMVIEAYIDKRVPTHEHSNFWSISIEGVKGFIHKAMVIDPFRGVEGSALGSKKNGVTSPHVDLVNGSVPRTFSALRNDLDDSIQNAYVEMINAKNAYNTAKNTYDSCSKFKPVRKLRLYHTMTDKENDYKKFIAKHEYLKQWRQDIDDGLIAWVAVNHKLAESFWFNPEGKDWEKTKDIIAEWFTDHWMSMMGAPDIVGTAAGIAYTYYPYLRTICDFVVAAGEMMWIVGYYGEELEEDLEDVMLRLAWYGFNKALPYAIDQAFNEMIEYIKDPAVHFDVVAGLNDSWYRGRNITLADFNRKMLKINESGYDPNGGKYDWESIPSMYNSVTMMKLTLMSKEGLKQLAEDLCEKYGADSKLKDEIALSQRRWLDDEDTESDYFAPVILGFLTSIDGDPFYKQRVDSKGEPKKNLDQYNEDDPSREWCIKDMIFGKYPCAYQTLFMLQEGQPDYLELKKSVDPAGFQQQLLADPNLKSFYDEYTDCRVTGLGIGTCSQTQLEATGAGAGASDPEESGSEPSIPPPPPDPAGGTLDSAYGWGTGSTVGGHLNNRADIDIYSYMARESMIYTLELSGLPDFVRPSLKIMDRKGHRIKVSRREKEGEVITFIIDINKDETHFFEVKGVWSESKGKNVPYRLTIKGTLPDPWEPDDTEEQAVEWDITKGPISGFLCELSPYRTSGRADYYRIRIPESLGKVILTISMENVPDNLRARLRLQAEGYGSASGNDRSAERGGPVKVVFSGGPGKPLILRVDGSSPYNVSDTRYRLRAETKPDPYEPNNGFDEAVSVGIDEKPISAYLFRGQDYYVVDVPEDLTGKILKIYLSDFPSDVNPKISFYSDPKKPLNCADIREIGNGMEATFNGNYLEYANIHRIFIRIYNSDAGNPDQMYSLAVTIEKKP